MICILLLLNGSHVVQKQGILTDRVVCEWIWDKVQYSAPIFNEQSSVSARLQLALEDSSGSPLTDVQEKLSDSLAAHTQLEGERETGRGRGSR